MLTRWARLLIIAGCLAGPAARAEVRTWTDVSGRTMQAEFVRIVDGSATFLKDGKLVTVPMTQLWYADRIRIKELESQRSSEPQVAAEASPRGAAAMQPVADASAAGSGAAGSGATKKNRVPAEIRVWTDLFGNQTRASFVRMNSGSAVLLRGGRALALPYYSLSAADREYVLGLLRDRGEEHLIPPPPTVDGSAAPAAPPPAPVDFFPPVAPDPPVTSPFHSLFGNASSPAEERMPRGPSEAARQLDELSRQQAERQRQSMEQARAANTQAMVGLERMMQSQQDAVQNKSVGVCSACRQSVTRKAGDPDKCPHCGVIWQYEVDSFGNKRILPEGTVAAMEQSSDNWSFRELHYTLRSLRPYAKLFFRVILPAIVCLAVAGAGALAHYRWS
jgi:hypothetical protein